MKLSDVLKMVSSNSYTLYKYKNNFYTYEKLDNVFNYVDNKVIDIIPTIENNKPHLMIVIQSC